MPFPFHQQRAKPLVREASDAKYVLLGEASHGTSEYYTIRSDLTKQLIQEHGFSFVAVEGDWPACYEVNRYIKGMAPEYSSAEEMLKKAFNRWPTWMWANQKSLNWLTGCIPIIKHSQGKKLVFMG